MNSVAYQVFPVSSAQLGSEFSDISSARQAFKEYAAANDLFYRIKMSNQLRFEVNCPDDSQGSSSACTFYFRCRSSKDGLVRVTGRNLQHSSTCRKFRSASTSAIIPIVRESQEMIAKVRPRDITRIIRRTMSAKARYMSAWRALDRVRSERYMDNVKSFGLVRSFLQQFTELNSGSVTKYEAFQNNRFRRAFLAPSASINAFSYCRPIIVTDACHIRSKFQGIIMSACTHDGEGKIVPLAIGLASVENQENWEFFMKHLRAAIPSIKQRSVVFIHDREKGLENARESVIPLATPSICVRHLEKNVIVRFRTKVNNKLWTAAKSFKVTDFDSAMESIQSLNAEVGSYLRGSIPERWARAKFPVPRFGVVTSNSAESHNSWMENIRNGSHLNVLHGWSTKMATKIFAKSQEVTAITDIFPNSTRKLIQKNELDARFYEFEQWDSFEFMVRKDDNSPSFNVNLELKKCTCRQFQEYLFPCVHASAVINERRLQYQDYCHPSYLVTSLQAAYRERIRPMELNDLQVDATALPPRYSRRAGRPRIRRIRSSSESFTTSAPVQCTNCEGLGHNSRTCRQAPQNEAISQLSIEAISNEDPVAAIPHVEINDALESSQPPTVRRRRTVVYANCGGNHYRRTPCRTNSLN